MILRAKIKETYLKQIGLTRGKDIIDIDWVGNDMALLYSYAKFSIYPSLYEGLGFPIVESMACGTPVITSDTSAMPEAAGGAALLVKNPKDPTEWAKKIILLNQDNELLISLSKKGIERAKAFAWPKIIKYVVRSLKRAV